MHRSRTGLRPLIGLLLLLVLGLRPGAAAAETAAVPPSLSARAAALIDAHSGQVLYELNGSVRHYPASTTKILTALLAAESDRLDEPVTAPEGVSAGPDGTSCYLQPGETHTLRELTACLLVASGNDAASVIAEYLGGTEEAFAAAMNRRAEEVGAKASHFVNPHGLHHPDHYTTALDLARIARAAFQNPEVRRLAGLKELTLQGPEPTPRVFYNHNRLLQDYPGMVAGKTGFTEEALHTLVALAERQGRGLIGVVLGAPSRQDLFADMARLLDWGFAAFAPQALVQAGEVVGTVPVRGGQAEQVTGVAGGDFDAWLPVGATWGPPMERVVNLVREVEAPVPAGYPLGEILIRQQDQVLARIPVRAREAVPMAEGEARLAGSARPWPVALGWAALAGVLLVWLRRRRLSRWQEARPLDLRRRATGRF
ncbi:MAG: D-alanyl-D-alanine carboxypeptidase [Firmicutes bacterium]|nr:D-alanyl-D-alanine carboxypeptidase [Bacillota bacterium]